MKIKFIKRDAELLGVIYINDMMCHVMVNQFDDSFKLGSILVITEDKDIYEFDGDDNSLTKRSINEKEVTVSIDGYYVIIEVKETSV